MGKGQVVGASGHAWGGLKRCEGGTGVFDLEQRAGGEEGLDLKSNSCMALHDMNVVCCFVGALT